MNTAASLFLKIFGSKIVRHVLALLTGFFAARHLELDASNMTTFLASLAAGLAIVVSSLVMKAEPGDDMKERVKDFVQALVTNGSQAVFGYLNAKGISISGDANVETTLLALLMHTFSSLSAPDSKKAAAKPAAK